MADPRHAKVNVKAEQSRTDHNHQPHHHHHHVVAATGTRHVTARPEIQPVASSPRVERIQAQRRLPAGGGECKPRTQPFNRDSGLEMQVQQQQMRETEERRLHVTENHGAEFQDVPLAT